MESPNSASDPRSFPESRPSPAYRYSGHETFACRYAWLPKAISAVVENPAILTPSKEDDAMVELGVGKNMVRSIRFWAECSGMIEASADGHVPTDIGTLLFVVVNDLEEEIRGGYDPYLEDIQTLWLVHWKLATNRRSLFFAWDFLLNRFQEPTLSTSSVVRALRKELAQHSISTASTEQLWDVFVHSYIPTRGRKGEVREDNLDCPLVELDLLIPLGITESSFKPGRTEQKFAFRREEKPEIGNQLFSFCLYEFWQNEHSQENSIPLHLIANGRGSPGQVFKIPEHDIRMRLLRIEEASRGFFRFEESASFPRVTINQKADIPSLEEIYRREEVHD